MARGDHLAAQPRRPLEDRARVLEEVRARRARDVLPARALAGRGRSRAVGRARRRAEPRARGAAGLAGLRGAALYYNDCEFLAEEVARALALGRGGRGALHVAVRA